MRSRSDVVENMNVDTPANEPLSLNCTWPSVPPGVPLPPPVIHTPLIAKHPPEISKPLDAVVVAPPPRTNAHTDVVPESVAFTNVLSVTVEFVMREPEISTSERVSMRFVCAIMLYIAVLPDG